MPAYPKYFPLDRKLVFGVEVRIKERQDNLVTQSSVAYNLILQPAQKQSWLDYCLQIERTPAVYSSQAPNPADDVVLQLAKPLQHVEIILDGKGVPKKLRNHAVIWQRWKEETRPAVLAANTGEWVESMVSKAETTLLHPEEVIQTLMSRDWILQQYFSGIHNSAAPGVFAFHVAGHAIPLREQWQYRQDNGMQYIEIAGELSKGAPATGWSFLVPRAIRSDAALIPVIRKHCNYRLMHDSLWSSGYDCSYHITFGDRYEKHIELQLSLQ